MDETDALLLQGYLEQWRARAAEVSRIEAMPPGDRAGGRIAVARRAAAEARWWYEAMRDALVSEPGSRYPPVPQGGASDTSSTDAGNGRGDAARVTADAAERFR